MTDTERKIYTELISSRLSLHRFKHSLCVSAEAKRLALRYGADPDKAELAGLLHDVMKSAAAEEQLDYIRRDGQPSEALLAAPKLYHAFAAAVYVRDELGIDDPEIIGAIRYHSTGRAGMTLLEKVVFIADFTSADRDYDDVGEIRRLCDISLEQAMRYAYAYTIPDLIAHDRPVHPFSVAAYNEVVIALNRA